MRVPSSIFRSILLAIGVVLALAAHPVRAQSPAAVPAPATTMSAAPTAPAAPSSSSAAEIAANTLTQYDGGFWMPKPLSENAKPVDVLFDVINWICAFFFVLIVVVMVYFMIKYRRRSVHDKAQGSTTHNTPLELTWTVIPLLLVIAIFFVGMEGYLDLRHAPIGAYEVRVVASRWSWSFEHRNGCSEVGVLRIPVGRPVKVMMESTDVLHAMYIPAYRVKQDIVPGRITTLWFQANAPGDFDLFCAEYCGKDHSQMLATVVARYEDEFQADLQDCADWAKKYAKEDLYKLAPKKIYPRCASCHSLDGKSGTGPTWKDVWHHITTGDVVFNDSTTLKDLMGPGKMFESPEDYVKQSILNPQQKIVMNYTGAMPTFKGQLKDDEIYAIIEFLKHMDEFDEKGNLKDPTKKPIELTPEQQAAAAKPLTK